MENVEVTETRGGNPKYTHTSTGIRLYLTRNQSQKDKGNASLYLGCLELTASDLTGKDSDNNKHDVRLKTIDFESHYDVCQAYMAQIVSLNKLGLTPSEICSEIYTGIKGINEPEVELGNLKFEFKELNKKHKQLLNELKDIQEQMDEICNEMEML